MWNDTDVPLAYFISFRCYGTWLHGDVRGSIDKYNNAYGSPKIAPNEHWNIISSARQKHAPVYLNAARRASVKNAIIDTCSKRNWHLYSSNIRTNHGHLVMANPGSKPELILSAIKANGTRQMREEGLWLNEHSPWSAGGSKRMLWNEPSIANAIDYVLNGQGDDLPDFDY